MNDNTFVFIDLRFPKEFGFFMDSRHRPFVPLVPVILVEDNCGACANEYWRCRIKVLRQKPVTLEHFVLNICWMERLPPQTNSQLSEFDD
jgi:hypothetical protein